MHEPIPIRHAQRARARRVRRLASAEKRERRLRARRGGRAWINGNEVGADERFAHLARSYD